LRVVERISGKGHKNITATHKTTLEFTKEKDVHGRGDCIIAVSASKGAADLSEDFKRLARSSSCKISVRMRVGDSRAEITGSGHPNLTFEYPSGLVIRKSHFTCGRTLTVGADKAAADIDRALIERLRDPEQEVLIELVAELRASAPVAHPGACEGCLQRLGSASRISRT